MSVLDVVMYSDAFTLISVTNCAASDSVLLKMNAHSLICLNQAIVKL